jgi:hypothetical protein
LNLLLGSIGSNQVVDLFVVLLLSKKVGHLTCVENVVDIFQEALIGDLNIGEDE